MMDRAQSFPEFGIVVGYPSQSNGIGAEAWPPITDQPIPGAFMPDGDVRPKDPTGAGWKPLGICELRPLNGVTRGGARILPRDCSWMPKGSQATGQCASVAAIAVFRRLEQRLHIPNMVVCEPGVGGANIYQLSKPPSNTSDSTDRFSRFSEGLKYVSRAIDKMAGDVSRQVIASISIQGESDILHGTTYEEYKSARISLWDDMDAEISGQFGQSQRHMKFVVIVGGGYTRRSDRSGRPDLSVQRALLDLSWERQDVVAVGPYYQGCDKVRHLTANGQVLVGCKIAEAMFKTLIRGEDFRALQPMRIERSGNTLDIHVLSDTPLQFDRFIYDGQQIMLAQRGFAVTDSKGRALAINGVEIAAPTTIRLRLKEAVPQGAFVWFAGPASAGNGNVCNSNDFDSGLKHTFLGGMYEADCPELDGQPVDCRDWLVPFVYPEGWERTHTGRVASRAAHLPLVGGHDRCQR